MELIVTPPVKPMLAKAVDGLPPATGSKWGDLSYEPKWDGFRCIVFRSGDVVELGSRNERPLTRYFPELVAPLLNQLPDRVVLDGELIVIAGDSLDFDGLQQRIHPAASRIERLAAQTPASFVAFDILALGDDDLRSVPFGERRRILSEVLASAAAPIYLTPTTTDVDTATRWFISFEGAGLDGLIAKPLADPYAENKRSQLKVKHTRTADVVVAGYRWHKDGKGVGSLLLGLHDDDGNLQHVGVAASFTAKRRTELVDELAPFELQDVAAHPWARWTDETAHDQNRLPGAQNRWSASKDHSWVPLRTERVAEVKYTSTLNGRLRDVARFLRWRPDKEPADCVFGQLDEPVPIGIDTVLAAGTRPEA